MWIFDPETNQLKEQEENQAKDVSGGSVSTSAPANVGVPTSGVGAGAAQSSKPAPGSGSNFTDINKYLAMNAGSAESVGNKVAGNIQNITGEANSALDQGQAQLNTALNKATPGLSKAEIDELANNPDKLVNFTNTNLQAPIQPGYGIPERRAPIAFGGTPKNNIENFKSVASGEYVGPNQFSDVGEYESLLSKVKAANNASDQTKSTGGREELIRGIYQKPERAKEGMLGLDEALMNQSETGIGNVNERAKEASTVDKRRSDIETSALKSIEDKKGEVSSRAKQIQDAFLGDAGTYARLKNAVTGRAADMAKTATEEQNDVKNWTNVDWLRQQGVIKPTPAIGYGKPGYMSASGALVVDQSKQVPQSVLNQLGITRDQFNKILYEYTDALGFQEAMPDWYGPGARGSGTPIEKGYEPFNPTPNLSEFFSYRTPEGSGINPSNVGTKQEYDELNALTKLFGSSIDPSIISDPNATPRASSDITDFKYDDLIKILDQENRALWDWRRNPTYPTAVPQKPYWET